MEETDNDTQLFLRSALDYTPEEDLTLLMQAVNCSCTHGAFAALLLNDSLEVTWRAHAMGYDTDGHRYFSIPLPVEGGSMPIERLHPVAEVSLQLVDGSVYPYSHSHSAWATRMHESVVRVSRGSGDNWYVTRLTGGPLVAGEPATQNKELAGRTVTAAEAKELGFAWVRVAGAA